MLKHRSLHFRFVIEIKLNCFGAESADLFDLVLRPNCCDYICGVDGGAGYEVC
jgi:hypothetical protein